MCGIAGIVSLSDHPVRDGDTRVRRMLDLLRHRGPDNEGIAVAGNGRIVFGNSRLAIVDTATNFPVPMRSDDPDVMLTYNGEIYNYLDQRRRLEEHGCRFRTHSDTEVLMQGLTSEGADFLQRLDGFWGFGFADGKSGRVILGRDLLGERQVYYRRSENEIVFASEINPLLADDPENVSLDADSIACAFRYRTTPPEKTLIAGVRRLLPGHLLTIERSGKVVERRVLKLHPERWFDFFADAPSQAKVLELYEEQLHAACRSRVPAEVDFLASLSGGLDSALVNLMASDFGRKSIKSLYAESAETSPKVGDDLSESQASSLISQRLNTMHTAIDLRSPNILDVVEDIADNSFDGVLCEGAIGFQLLAREVRRQGARVLILSDGPDELLGGYGKDVSALRIDAGLQDDPRREEIWKLARNGHIDAPPVPDTDPDDYLNWTYLNNSPFSFRPIHGGTADETISALFGAEDAERSYGHYGSFDSDYSDLLPQLDPAQRMSLTYAGSSLPNYFNCRSDRGVMRQSVESRLPLQAPALAELMIATPTALRFGDNWDSKNLLREIVARHLGPEIAYRKKYGFYTPPWRLPAIGDRLNLESEIRDSSVFRDLPFASNAVETILSPSNSRLRWFAFSLARMNARIKSRDFGYPVAVPAHSAGTWRPAFVQPDNAVAENA
jgi:asparagine synthase (glutamine-hydrolysing)